MDIQPIAVQIAKMRFFISLAIEQKPDPTQPNLGIRPLPNLETKFVAANTLIGIERPNQAVLRNPLIDAKEAELRQVRERHFTARTPATKARLRELDAKIRAEISELLRADGFPRETTEKLANWNPYDQNATADFFDPEWMFGIRNGFDIVIGNPPYIRQEEIKALKPVLQAQGYTCYTGTADLYVYFYERALQLLRDGGVLAFISSNKYFRAAYGEKLRAMLASQTIHRIIDFGDAPVFTAISYPSIIVLTKTPAVNNTVRALNWKPGPPIEQLPEIFRAQSFHIAQRDLRPDGWRLESPAALRLLEKLRAAGTPLGEYVKGRFYRGILTGLDEAFVVDRATRDRLIAEHPSSAEILKPFLRGRDIKRWRCEFGEQYLITIESSENKQHPWSGKNEREAERIFAKTYPAIHAWFDTMRQALIDRYDQGQYFWELRFCDYWREFEQSKIIYPDICEHQSFAWDTARFYVGNTAYFISTNQRWLVALLNSQCVEWFYGYICNRVRGSYMRAFSDYMRQIPIPPATSSQQREITALADKILALKQADPNADVSALEREIDERVYRLYGLTPE
ncbi:MAG: Eco57I restriction-modification methylase domain-containing protein [Bacteroidetes bacterium]|nr:Eco57I restriction-modification methylase domain-containing protein [Bacteroidota bacterium]